METLRSPVSVSSVLSIPVVGGTGRGPTALAAFDAALADAGVANYNLVRLSSVIPPRSRVMVVAPDPVGREGEEGAISPAVGGGWGDRLYAVWAFQSAELLGQEAWAGVAWVQQPDDGRGLFVEHEGGSEAQVREELAATLTSLCQIRGIEGLEQHSHVVGTKCEGGPVGALVIAPFRSEVW